MPEDKGPIPVWISAKYLTITKHVDSIGSVVTALFWLNPTQTKYKTVFFRKYEFECESRGSSPGTYYTWSIVLKKQEKRILLQVIIHPFLACKRNFMWPSMQRWQCLIHLITLKPLSDQVWIRYLCLQFWKLIIFTCVVSLQRWPAYF